jgi:hypothetical protein
VAEHELTEDEIVETLKKHGITNLSELAQKTLENAHKTKHPVTPQYLITGPAYTLHHPEHPPAK